MAEPIILPPSERPHCRQCDARLEPKPKWDSRRVEDADGFHTERVVVGCYGYGYDGDNLFCSLRCGYKWALRRIA